MTRSAPSVLSSSRCDVAQTAVTVAPKVFNSWTAADPMALVAP